MSDICLITKDTILPRLQHMDWDVVINGIPYYVVAIEGYVHTIGGQYGENNLWAYPRDKAPTYETLVEFGCDNPVAWGIRYEPRNYTKTKWDETKARSSGWVAITRNDEIFCRIPGGMNYGIDQARVMIAEFNEHPLNLNSINFDKKAIGRKVWWRSEPAVVTNYIDQQACVILKPDGIPKFTIPPEFADEDSDFYVEGDVKAEILSQHIWWFRD